MSHSETAHNWAHQTGKARNSRSLFYDGDTIYSYGRHFPIARLLNGVVLFTTREYSVSTAKHKSRVWSACHHLIPILVENVMAERREDHLANMKAGFTDAAKSMESAKRARVYRDAHISSASRTMESLRRYAEIFLPKDKFNFDLDVCADQVRLAEERERRREAREQKKRAKKEAERLAQWMNGDIAYATFPNSPCRLRVNELTPLENVIETSLGASIPYEDGELCFRFAIAKRKKGWHRNGELFSVGSYQLDAVNEQGIVAGCHRIAWDEIERFAKQQGWKE